MAQKDKAAGAAGVLEHAPVGHVNRPADEATKSRRLPANLIQAQRDYFGAHGYRRLDREGSFHTEWE